MKIIQRRIQIHIIYKRVKTLPEGKGAGNIIPKVPAKVFCSLKSCSTLLIRRIGMDCVDVLKVTNWIGCAENSVAGQSGQKNRVT